MNEYLSGRKLYGDDFSFEQIKQWYEEEAEAYANLGNKDIDSYPDNAYICADFL